VVVITRNSLHGSYGGWLTHSLTVGRLRSGKKLGVLWVKFSMVLFKF